MMRVGSSGDASSGCRAAERRRFSASAGDGNLGLRLARVPSGAPSPAPKALSADPDRRAAEYILSIGGTVYIDGNDREIRAPGELPAGSFRLTQVGLLNNKQVTDSGLAAFKDCKSLTVFNLADAKVTDAGLVHLEVPHGSWTAGKRCRL
jgi:hypothetical protein